MGVRSRLTDLRTNLRKVFGTAKPADVAAGEAAAGMTPTRPFSPGEPIGPYDGYSRHPRSRDFTTGYNIAARPRSHERVAFETLKGLIEAYDVAQIAIWHRIDSIRALDWSLVPARGFKGDADEAIDLGMAALEKPDRETPFATWLAKWLYDILAYDAGCLYRMRNRRGETVGLRPVDGTSIAPLLDYWGNSPKSPAEAYVQYVQGLPWNWLTRDDLIYEPFRPVTGSPYGRAPLESILLNANTDLRFQAYFLQRFTEGNIPAAFASAPETWSPAQIEQFQEYWDAFMLGDQSLKHQIRWIPGGSTIAWSNEKEFEDRFSLFLMRKSLAAYHVVPADVGFTEDVNRSSGETQGDVQHRIGDLPLLTHAEGIITGFLKNDLRLPLEFAFDDGQEKEDRLQLAQAWKIYVETGAASADEMREKLLGLPGDPQRPTPRFFAVPRVGPVPLLAIDSVAGRVDPETFGPAKDQPALPQPYVPALGALPAPGSSDDKASRAAQDAYQLQVRDQLQARNAGQPVAKDSAPTADVTAGVTTETGIVGYDLVGDEDDEEQPPPGEAELLGKLDKRLTKALLPAADTGRRKLVRREMAAYRVFRKARTRAGRWRDFEFRHVDRVRAHRLNDAGRLAVRKAAGEVAVAGLAVRAADTGRILMLQRALDPDDPAGGTWEFPGGHLEADETPLQGAWREWAEETGRVPPPGEKTGEWTSADGVYRGIVWTVESEACVPVDSRDGITNPDDPDGDAIEAIAWWDPQQLPGNPAVRPELLTSIGAVLRATAPCSCCGGCGEHTNGYECSYCDACGTEVGASGSVPCAGAAEGVAKAGGGGPKALAPAGLAGAGMSGSPSTGRR
jgi:8-oxo-dGTP pyrophosphatase MutT (NUDIX family)